MRCMACKGKADRYICFACWLKVSGIGRIIIADGQNAEMMRKLKVPVLPNRKDILKALHARIKTIDPIRYESEVASNADLMKDIEEEPAIDLDEEKYYVSKGMRAMGGSFTKCMGEALAHAHPNNVIKIRNNWKEDWDEYLQHGKRLHEKEMKR